MLFGASQQTVQKRLEECLKCEHLHKIKFRKKVIARCRKCGCIMNMKARLINAECPVGKW